jgi:subtilisin family serine protease
MRRLSEGRCKVGETAVRWGGGLILAALLGVAGAGLWPGASRAIGQQEPAVTAELERALSRAAPLERIPVLVEVSRADAPPPLALERGLRAAEHASNLAGVYGSSVQRLKRGLPAGLSFDLDAGRVIWIGGAIAARLTAEQVRVLAARPDVQRIYYDGLVPVDLSGGVEPGPPLLWAPGLPPAPQDPAGGLPWGLEAIGAPRLWEAGATGSGAVVAIIDSGVDGDHPLLWRKWRGLGASPEEAWFDPWGLTRVPVDDDGTGGIGHGTIVATIAVGSLEPGDTLLELGGTRVVQDELEVVTGVAPGAQWVAANAFEVFGSGSYTRRSVLLQALQWVLDPDGDPATISDVPDVVNNSWGFRPSGCDGVFDRAIDALELAGVPVVFAAGNRSAGFDTVAAPAERADLLLNAFAVGAAEQKDGEIRVADNSLGGPSPCAPGAVKPEVVAPGDVPLVRGRTRHTAEVRGRSGAFTSWSAPHATGALALLAGLSPSAGANELKGALFSTAVDLPPPGLDNRSGAGLIDLVAAAERIGGLGGVLLALDGWEWDTAAATLSLNLLNRGARAFPGGSAELRRRDASEPLARAAAPLIRPRERGQVTFRGVPSRSGDDARLRLVLEGGGARIELPVFLRAASASSVTLADGGVRFSLDALGRLGRVAAAPGFSFLGRDWLTAGAFLFAVGDRVSDAAYVDVLQRPALKSNPVGSDTDWREVSVSGAAKSAELEFSDSRALRPLGASVRQRADLVAIGDSAAFVALTASVVFGAVRGAPLAGLLLDWDFDGGEFVGWDGELGASVMVPSDSPGPWLAVTTAPRPPTTHAVVPLGTPENGFYSVGARGVLAKLQGFTDAEKARFLSLGGLQASDSRVSDWAQLVGVGPLQSGDTIIFLVAAGASRSALGIALDSARAFARRRASPASAAAAGRGLELPPPYPNPFDPNQEAVTLPFLVNRGSEPLSATLEIYTITGRPVYEERRELPPELPVEPFRWSGRLANGETAATGVYGYVIRVGGRAKSGKFLLLK